MKVSVRKLLKLAQRLTVVLIIAGFFAGVLTRYLFQESALMIWSRYVNSGLEWQRAKFPMISWASSIVAMFIIPDRVEAFEVIKTKSLVNTPMGWKSTLVGYSADRRFAPATYDLDGKPQIWKPQFPGVQSPEGSAQNIITVSTASDVRRVVRQAIPGQVIQLLPGIYEFVGKSLVLRNSGSSTHPITITAAQPGTAVLKFNIPNGFFITGPFWVVQNLVIEGHCERDSACEHAFHIVGNAYSTIIRNNWVSDFDAPVKVNTSKGGAPDRGLIEYNSFRASHPRRTTNPVTFLDFVATNDWVVRKNLIADFSKQLSNQVSYGAFFKGAGENNIFEQNLVVCEWTHRGGTRIGFSFGGGSTGKQYCRDSKCEYEQQNSIARNNIIMNCPRDVGIYVNKSKNSLINNNLLYNTRGIDVRFPQSQATIVNNIIDGRILAREGGRFTAKANLTSPVPFVSLSRISDTLFADPMSGDFRLIDETKIIAKGMPMADPGSDFCDRVHDAQRPDIGPFNYQAGLSLGQAKRRECLTILPLSD